MRQNSLTVSLMQVPPETRILDAAKVCCERYGLAKVSVDDVANLAGVSRATLYRLFPGGKDVLLEALRVRDLGEFFARVTARVDGADGLEDLLVRLVVVATLELRADEHLSIMLATEPGETMREISVDGLPRIIGAATRFLVPMVDAYLPRSESLPLVELLARLVISYFLAPSAFVDLGDPLSASRFLQAHVLSALPIKEYTR